jgi:PAS domain S-box-containing protein
LSEEQTFGALFAAVHVDGGLIVRRTTIEYANDSAARLLASPRDELIGADVSRWLPLVDGESAQTWLAARAGEIYEETLRCGDGDRLPARLGITALDEEKTTFAMSIHDIREARMLAQALESEIVEFENRRLALLDDQQAMIRALSLPVLRIWSGVIAIPLLGPLDQARAAETLARLLEEVVASSARHVIIDLTGLQSVDVRSVAYLASMVRTLGLLGSNCVIAGIRPELARVLVDEQIPLANAMCFATQHEALVAVLQHLGWSLTRAPEQPFDHRAIQRADQKGRPS